VGNESVLCQVCQGVLPASGREAYTPLRGRLILTNGYCGGDCAERRGGGAEQVRSAPQQQAAGPVAVPMRRPQVAAAPMGPGVRVSR